MIRELIRRVIPARFRPIVYFENLVRTRTNLTVQKGPFQGMRYLDYSLGSAYIPKLLGIYERELNPLIQKLIERNPRFVIDLGAAEGYYAIGFAKRLPEAQVVAYEMEPRGQRALADMARLNDVMERVTVKGRCEPEDLAVSLGEHCDVAVVCDVEGHEEQLMDPKLVPALRNALILVELHDWLAPNISETLMTRFAPYHNITRILQEPRDSSDFPYRTLGTTVFSKSYLDWAVSEWRPVPMQMSWLWMVPISGQKADL